MGPLASRRLGRPVETGLVLLAFLAFSVFLLAPAFYVFRGSFQQAALSLASSSGGWTLENYVRLFASGFWVFVINSLVVSLGATLVSCTLSLFSAYALSRFRFRGRGLVFGAIMGGQFFPWIVLVNPIFIIFARSGLINSQLGLVLCYTAFVTPFTVYLLVGYLATIPRSLDEAAIMDGASRLSVIWLVIVPIIWPGIVAAATFSFLQCWSEYLLALALITKDSLKTLPLGLYQYFGDVQTDWGAVMAGSVIATVPTLLLFLPLQKKLVSGLTQGAVK